MHLRGVIFAFIFANTFVMLPALAQLVDDQLPIGCASMIRGSAKNGAGMVICGMPNAQVVDLVGIAAPHGGETCGANVANVNLNMRDYWHHPGGNGSVWNTPFGDGAIWGNDSEADTQAIRHGGIINPANYFGVTIWHGTTNDPVKDVTGSPTVGNTGGSILLHVPNDAFAPSGGDGATVFYDSINYWGKIFSLSQANFSSKAVMGILPETDDATADNFGEDQETGLQGFIFGAGIITDYDFDVIRAGGHMRHMLRYSTDAMYLKDASIDGFYKLGPRSWPQQYEDRQELQVNLYHGDLLAGTTIGIPINVPMPAGLSKGGQEIFWTLQHYGALFRDQAGGGIHFNGEQANDNDPLLNDMRNDLPQIIHYLKPLRNQHVGGQPFATSPKNGPGNRVDSGPPLLAAQDGSAKIAGACSGNTSNFN